jgi:predicted Fe-S protein YdhL (DUF1289 family)
MVKKKEKTQWEINQEQAAATWKSMTQDQQQAVLEMLQAFVPIRQSVSELCEISYEDLRNVDQAWHVMRRLIVDDNVEVKYWSY